MAATNFCQLRMEGSTTTPTLDIPAMITAHATGFATAVPTIANCVQWTVLQQSIRGQE